MTMKLYQFAISHFSEKVRWALDYKNLNYQPVFLIDQIISICEFEGIPYQMRPDLIDRAWANMFVKDEHIVK